ncbi:MAG: phosphatase PAP2 family protein [Caldilineaceae bacterium]|nr:phosphatase PAP2 family protein [Caldilineaceae bacterium]
MTVIPKEEIGEQTVALGNLGQSRVSQFAYWISQIGSPPLTGATTAFLLGFALSTLSAWGWAWFYVTLTILVPCAYILWMVRAGQAVDFHLPNREQRIRPLQLSLVTALITWFTMYQWEAPRLLQMLATINGIQSTLFLLITYHWKISLHCAAATILSGLAFALFGTPAAPLTMSVPLIAWSRVYLERHTIGQTIAGTLLGAAILTPAWYLLV